MEGYCFKCKEKKSILEGQKEETKNHRLRVHGKCEKCGGKISNFVKKEKQVEEKPVEEKQIEEKEVEEKPVEEKQVSEEVKA